MTRFFPNPYVDRTGEAIHLLQSEANPLQEALKNVQSCLNSSKPSVHDGCLYTGSIGVAWAALYVSKSLHDQQLSTDLLHKAQDLIEHSLLSPTASARGRRRSDTEQELSFLCGLPGVWLTAASLYHKLGEMSKRNGFLQQYAQLSTRFASDVVFPQGSDELFIGRAGYLCGLNELRRLTHDTILENEAVYLICDKIISSGQSYSSLHHGVSPLMYAYHGTEYLGAAHGLCGILFALLLFPDYFKTRKETERLVKTSVDYLISVTPSDTGNLPAATDELPPHHRLPGHHELVHWCHGATGAIFLFVRSYLLWNEEKYLNCARCCADVIWNRGFLKKGPGICHGVAGSGYAQLVLYRLTGETRYLARAKAFAQFLEHPAFQGNARVPDSPFSLFEGLAGTACFLADLTNPAKAAFPFMDPFVEEAIAS